MFEKVKTKVQGLSLAHNLLRKFGGSHLIQDVKW
jgi:hypothetical protein